MRMYTIFDKVASEFGPLFTAKNDAVAKRMVKTMINNDHRMLQNLDDFELYVDCDFNVDNGLILPVNEQRGTKDQSLPFLISSLNDVYAKPEELDNDET